MPAPGRAGAPQEADEVRQAEYPPADAPAHAPPIDDAAGVRDEQDPPLVPASEVAPEPQAGKGNPRPVQDGNGRRRRRRGRGGRGGPPQAPQSQPRPQDQQPQRGQDAQRSRHVEGGQAQRGHGERRHEPSRGALAKSSVPVKRELLASTSFEETRIAVVEDGRLAELLWERKSEESIVGNIYKGVVENVLPGISSAFVSIGFEKNAYLYISDVLGERGAAIDATLKKGQQIMVQVAKEAIGTKGMKVTMDVSLPGRYLVFTPFQNYVGISKNIEEPQERVRLASIVDRLVAEHLGGKGVVVRTEAEGAGAEDLEREVKYLLGAWKAVQQKFETSNPPALLHRDLDLTLQAARDILSDEVYVYLLDNKQAHQNVVEFVKGISPELVDRVRHYDARTPIFKAFHLESEIESIRKVKVDLPNGGSIVIQEAESLCAIDVNTGRFTGSKSQEETVTQTNIEAALEVAHQLRLRNIGGIIVVDFIDMRKASNRNKVMEAFARAVRLDRAKIRILPITRLGLIEMTRERKRESTGSLITDECPQCKGSGRVLSAETLRIRIQREICEMTGGRPGGQVRIQLHPGLAESFRSQQATIEKNVQRSVKIQSDPQLPWEDYRIVLE